VLSTVSRDDWSPEGFPWLSVRETFIGIAPATVMSVSFSGELAYEIHVPNAQLYAAYLALRRAGEPHGLKLFGNRAVDSMRIEKGYLHWKGDVLTEFDPFETGLSRFVKIDKGDFMGKEALALRQIDGPRRRFVTMKVDCTDCAAHGGASVMSNGRVVGTVTSGEWGHRTGLNLAMAFVEPALADEGTEVQIDILGTLIPAEVIAPSPYDPHNARVKC
jgi:dimethylglycine dehydrogenase